MLNRRALLQGIVGVGAAGAAGAVVGGEPIEVADEARVRLMSDDAIPQLSLVTLRMVFCDSNVKDSSRYDDYQSGHVSTSQLIAAIENAPRKFNDLREANETVGVLWLFANNNTEMPLMWFEVKGTLNECPVVVYHLTAFGASIMRRINNTSPSDFIKLRLAP